MAARFLLGLIMTLTTEPTTPPPRVRVRNDHRSTGARKYMRGSLVDRFWNRVQKNDEGCWGWTGSLSPAGYGRLYATKTRSVYAHRVSFDANVSPIPDGMEVCHRCDNPARTRPDHLFLGTHAENMADMRAKGRGGVPPRHKGEECPSAVLSSADVLEIDRRLREGESQTAIARDYSVSKGAVQRIAAGKTWAHLTGRAHFSAPDYVEVVR